MAKKNNKGFSLVEMIVVITIMVIVTVGACIAGLYWKGSYFTDSVKKLDSGLAATKVDCMNKQTGSLTITYDDTEEIYYMQVSNEEPEALGDNKVKISYKKSSGSGFVEIDESESLSISYDRGTGAFSPIEVNASGDKIYCEEIKVKRAGQEAIFKLEKNTGKHYVD